LYLCSRKRPGLLYALAVALPFTAQAEETVVVTASPPASASARNSHVHKIILNLRGLVLLYAAAGKTNLSLFVKK
jgi:hypothetical protein